MHKQLSSKVAGAGAGAGAEAEHPRPSPAPTTAICCFDDNKQVSGRRVLQVLVLVPKLSNPDPLQVGTPPF
jgi:hypothetical protein